MTTRDVPPWLSLPVPVSAREMSHWEDFDHDARRLPRGNRGSTHGVLATLYHGFVRLIAQGAAVPEIPFPRRAPAFRIAAVDDETRRFDRLAEHFGAAYRGGSVANYLLGVLAVGFALLGVVFGTAIAHVPVFGVLEIAVLLLILFVHLMGRERDHGAAHGFAAGGGARRLGQRWHTRWLDYRGLAERFRYAALRGLLGGAASVPAADPAEAADEDWCTRHFRHRLLATAWPAATPADYAANLVAALDEQQRYHCTNSHRLHRLAHRLHGITVASFWLAGAFAVAELLLHVTGATTGGDSGHGPRDALILATAGLPAFAAAVHGIQSACEFGKLARSSDDMYEALTSLRVDVDALVRRDPALATPASVEALRAWTERFLHLCTDEATGWRTALADKNVPLP